MAVLDVILLLQKEGVYLWYCEIKEKNMGDALENTTKKKVGNTYE